jgi:hypothetical protein
MKYKTGDKVKVKSLEWYNENKNEFGEVEVSDNVFTSYMSKFCGSIVTIQDIDLDVYVVKENECYWTDDMFEEIAEEKTTRLLITGIIFPNKKYADKVELHLGDDYEIVVEDGRTFVQKKKPQYPKTFIEVLNFWHPDRQIEDDYQRYYKKDLIEKFQNLLYARDAYWKIAGEQMGLGKPWEPDWCDYNPNPKFKYIITTIGDYVVKDTSNLRNYILAFPTEEMRDEFYKNFNDLINKVKELL